MLTRRHALTGALATLLAGPAAAEQPTFTWTPVTWQGREYMQGNYKTHWAACLTRDFSWQRDELEAMLRGIA